jgi:hypothetical protein
MPGHVNAWNLRVVEPLELFQQKALGRHGETRILEQIARDKNGHYVLANGEIDRPAESGLQFLAKAASELFRATKKEGIEMDISQMKKLVHLAMYLNRCTEEAP